MKLGLGFQAKKSSMVTGLAYVLKRYILIELKAVWEEAVKLLISFFTNTFRFTV